MYCTNEIKFKHSILKLQYVGNYDIVKSALTSHTRSCISLVYLSRDVLDILNKIHHN